MSVLECLSAIHETVCIEYGYLYTEWNDADE